MSAASFPEARPWRRVLVAVDPSPAAQRAAAQAVAAAHACGAALRVMHVADPRLLLGDLPLHDSAQAAMDAQAAAGQRLVEAWVAHAASAGVTCDGVVRRDPPQRVADLVLREVDEWGADLLVIGSHGRHGLARLVLGSEAEAVVRRCGVPVLVVRDPAQGAADARRASSPPSEEQP